MSLRVDLTQHQPELVGRDDYDNDDNDDDYSDDNNCRSGSWLIYVTAAQKKVDPSPLRKGATLKIFSP